MVEEEEEETEDKKVKGKIKFGILISIVFTGFLTGLFYGISNKIGFSLSSDSILVSTVGNFCTAIDNFFNSGSSGCGINFTYVAWALTGLGIIEILISISKLKNWILGLIIFGIGFLIGFFIV